MPVTIRLPHLGPVASLQGQQPGWLQALVAMLGQGLEVGTILLTFTLAIFLVLVFAVRLLAIVRKLPVPVNVVDMAKPIDFRALMLGAAAVLTPLVAQEFLPVQGPDLGSTLVAAYILEVPIVAILWLALHLLYTVRAKRG